MTTRKNRPDTFAEIERPHELLTDGIFHGSSSEPLAVRIGDLWSDLFRAAAEADRARERPRSAVPLLDDMKGILQWD
jgi:hypothetical protein